MSCIHHSIICYPIWTHQVITFMYLSHKRGCLHIMIKIFGSCLILLSCLSFSAVASRSENNCKNPIVLVPGLGGSVLNVTYKQQFTDYCNSKHTAILCSYFKELRQLWPSVAALDFVPPHVLRNLWFDVLQGRYFGGDSDLSFLEGVIAEPLDYGGTDGISNLFGIWGHESTLDGLPWSSVFEYLVKELVDKQNYVIRENLFGAPYDFRKVSDQSYLFSSFLRLKHLIELAYDKAATCTKATTKKSVSRRVHIAGHSLGGPYVLAFLNNFVSANWKKKYIQSYIPIGSPFVGAPKALRTLISGDSEGLPGHNTDYLAIESLMGGLHWMVPYPEHFDQSLKLVEVDGQRYDSSPIDLMKLLSPYSRSEVIKYYERSFEQTQKLQLQHPGVDVLCMFGHGIVTEYFYSYQHGLRKDPVLYREPYYSHNNTLIPPNDDLRIRGTTDIFHPMKKYLQTDENQGDGTVPLHSLEICSGWKSDMKTEVKRYKGVGHVSILKNGQFIQDFVKHVKKHETSHHHKHGHHDKKHEHDD